MLEYPIIDPIAISLGPLKVHWYGLMYLIGFAAFWLLGVYRASSPDSCIAKEQVGDLLFYGVLGAILGGRVGYMLAYNFTRLLEEPLSLFYVWQGGMSFHGGLAGVVLAIWWFSKQKNLRFLQVADFSAPLVPIGIGAGRIGNFINGELWGRISDVPWAMVFPQADNAPRHPSQLYEFLLEGVVLFIVLWLYSRRPHRLGQVSGLFLILYAVMRIGVEFFREPDAHIGFVVFEWGTLGQLLSLPLLILGIVLFRTKTTSEGSHAN